MKFIIYNCGWNRNDARSGPTAGRTRTRINVRHLLGGNQPRIAGIKVRGNFAGRGIDWTTPVTLGDAEQTTSADAPDWPTELWKAIKQQFTYPENQVQHHLFSKSGRCGWRRTDPARIDYCSETVGLIFPSGTEYTLGSVEGGWIASDRIRATFRLNANQNLRA